MFTAIKDGSLEAISSLLALFYSLPIVGGSYGLAIMMLTATVMIVLMPLTVRATRSTIKMTQLQPELRALQKKHKDDRQELNAAMMALYQEHGVNPVGGCLPMLAQLPVFLLLFNVLRGVTRRVSDKAYFTVADEAHRLTGATTGSSDTFDPAHLDQSTELYQDLSQTTEMNFLGVFDLSLNPWDVVQSDFLGSIPYVILILFVVATSYYQQRQISARRGAVPDNPTPQQQTQQQLLRILPLMSGIWSFLFPAGLVLYWATSNVFRIGQQSYITRALYSGDGPGVKLAEQQEAEDDDDQDDDGEASGLIGDGRPARGSKNGSGKSGTGKSGTGKSGAGKSGTGKSGGRSGSGASGSGKGRSGGKSGAGSENGDADRNGGGTTVDRNEAWEKRRAQRANAQKRRKSTGGGSTRTTPKGTKPSDNRGKRKNKR